MRSCWIGKAAFIVFAAALLVAAGCSGNPKPPEIKTGDVPAGQIDRMVIPAPNDTGGAVEAAVSDDLFVPIAENKKPLSGFEAFLVSTGNFRTDDTEVFSVVEESGEYKIALHFPLLRAGWFDEAVSLEAENAAGEFIQLVGDQPAGGRSYELHQDFELYRPYDSLVSIIYSLYRDQPGAEQPLTLQKRQNCDLRHRSEIKLWDLLDGKYLDYISKRCIDQVLNSGAFTGDAEILITQKLNPSQRNFSEFILLKDYIVFFFPNIYSWDMGGETPWVAMSYAEIASFLSRDYRFLIDRLPGSIYEGTPPASYILEDNLEVYGDQPQVALSFDDGPSSLTPRLLDILAANDAHATFFVMGNRVRHHKDTLLRMLDEGHEIGNHTWSHKMLSGQSAAVFEDQVIRTQQVLIDTIGYEPKLLRPSYGAIDNRVRQLSPLPLILWSVDPEDWKYRDAEILVPAIISKVKDGDIILLHDMYESTIEATEQVLHELDGMGFKVVTVSQLQRRHGEHLEPGQVYRKNPPSLMVMEE